jgi:hypothetical protein
VQTLSQQILLILIEEITRAGSEVNSQARQARQTRFIAGECFGFCVNAVPGCFCPEQIFFCFLGSGQLHYLAACGRRQGRAFFSAFIGGRRGDRISRTNGLKSE